MLNLDLSLCETGERFQNLCFRLARKEFTNCIPVGVGSWDKGIDIIEFSEIRSKQRTIWQCKFTKSLSLSRLKGKITKSLETLDVDFEFDWILCISNDATGEFLAWLGKEIRKFPLVKSFKVWDRVEILRRLEENRDILEIFFYRSFAELERHFISDELHLVDFQVTSEGSWAASDPKVLKFHRKSDGDSDMVVDIIVKNSGASEALLREIHVEVFDAVGDLKGIPEEALLLPKITYEISLKGGKPGAHKKKLEPPLLVKPRSHERFKVKIRDIGYAWYGELKISLRYGHGKALQMPVIFVYT